MAGLPLVYYVPLVSALGVVFALMFNRANGSVLLCILLHAGVNFGVGVFGPDVFTSGGAALPLLLTLTVGWAILETRRSGR